MNALRIFLRDAYLLAVLAVLVFLEALPSRLPKRLAAAAAGSAAYLLSRRKRRAVEKSLNQAFPEYSPARKRGVARESFRAFWLELFSLSPPRREPREPERISIEGLERLESALLQGRGAILWESSSFGSRSLAKQALNQRGFDLIQLHSEFHLAGLPGGRHPSRFQKHVVKPFLERREKRFIREIIEIPASNSLAFTRRALQRLQSNRIVCSAGDGTIGQKSVELNFLGRRTPFFTGLVALSRISGAPIFPLLCVRRDDGRFAVEIAPAAPVGRGREEDAVESLSYFCRLLESRVRCNPGQYLSWDYLQTYPRRPTSGRQRP